MALCGCRGGGHAGNVSASPTQELAGVSDAEPVVDAGEPVRMLQQEFSAGAPCLSSRDAARRFQVVGPNESPVHRRRWAADRARHVTHPLAPLVWVAAGLSWMVVATNPAIAVLTVVLLNAGHGEDSAATVGGHGRGAWSNRWNPPSPVGPSQHGRRGRSWRRGDLPARSAVGVRYRERAGVGRPDGAALPGSGVVRRWVGEEDC